MLSSIGRAAIRRGGAGACCASTNRAAQSIWTLQRVTVSRSANEPSTESRVNIAFPRFYATATKTVAKPKKPTTTKAKPKTKAKKPLKKAVKKPVKKKAAKPKAKKPKKPVKKVLTDEQKERVKLKVLKEKALSLPSGLPDTAWLVLLQSNTQVAGASGPRNLGSTASAASVQYKALPAEEKELLNQKAIDNKLANETAFKKWLQSYTPQQIKDANNARAQLKRKLQKPHSFPPIADPRLPKRPFSATVFFTMDRHASGDFKGIKIPDASKLIAQEWKSLPAGERKQFEDRARADRQRYQQEFKTVYHRNSGTAA